MKRTLLFTYIGVLLKNQGQKIVTYREKIGGKLMFFNLQWPTAGCLYRGRRRRRCPIRWLHFAHLELNWRKVSRPWMCSKCTSIAHPVPSVANFLHDHYSVIAFTAIHITFTLILRRLFCQWFLPSGPIVVWYTMELTGTAGLSVLVRLKRTGVDLKWNLWWMKLLQFEENVNFDFSVAFFV